jgi:hypothetical protein
VPSLRSVAELKENVASFTTEILVDLWQELRDKGLVPTDVPVSGIDEWSRGPRSRLVRVIHPV